MGTLYLKKLMVHGSMVFNFSNFNLKFIYQSILFVILWLIFVSIWNENVEIFSSYSHSTDNNISWWQLWIWTAAVEITSHIYLSSNFHRILTRWSIMNSWQDELMNAEIRKCSCDGLEPRFFERKYGLGLDENRSIKCTGYWTGRKLSTTRRVWSLWAFLFTVWKIKN